jgi:hypothetical protein
MRAFGIALLGVMVGTLAGCTGSATSVASDEGAARTPTPGTSITGDDATFLRGIIANAPETTVRGVRGKRANVEVADEGAVATALVTNIEGRDISNVNPADVGRVRQLLVAAGTTVVVASNGFRAWTASVWCTTSGCAITPEQQATAIDSGDENSPSGVLYHALTHVARVTNENGVSELSVTVGREGVKCSHVDTTGDDGDGPEWNDCSFTGLTKQPVAADGSALHWGNARSVSGVVYHALVRHGVTPENDNEVEVVKLSGTASLECEHVDALEGKPEENRCSVL